MSFFQDAANTFIQGSVVFNAVQNFGSKEVDKGLKILYQNAAPGALHNSGERFDAPNCHPATRVTLQHKILSWLNDRDTECSAMWINGGIGAGKSALAQTIAQLCYEQGQLLSSFFFGRSSAGRNNEKKLVATLAYQMSLQIPDTRPHISAAILHNPLILQSSLQIQIETLITGPLSRVPSAVTKPMLIIIDGLDECEGTSAQDHVVRIFVSSIATMRCKIPIPPKILIVSRPATNIKTVFDGPSISASTVQISIKAWWLPDADIRKFLVDSFEEFKATHISSPVADIEELLEKATHPLKRFLSTDWTPVADFERLLKGSSDHRPVTTPCMREREVQGPSIQGLVHLGMAMWDK